MTRIHIWLWVTFLPLAFWFFTGWPNINDILTGSYFGAAMLFAHWWANFPKEQRL